MSDQLSDPTKDQRDDVFDFSDHDGQDEEPADPTSPLKKKAKRPGNLSNRVSVITLHTTPRKEVGPDHPFPHNPDQQVRELPVIVEPQPPVRLVEFFDGSGSGSENTIFLGLAGNRNWDKEKLVNYHFVINNPLAKTVTLRTMEDCPMEMVHNRILQIFTTVQAVMLDTPILSYQGVPVDLNSFLLQYPNHALFIIVDKIVPETFLHHSGLPWQCTRCGVACKIRKSFEGTRNKKKCAHDWLFDVQHHVKSLGTTLDRSDRNKPWATPEGHDGALPIPEPVPLQQPCLLPRRTLNYTSPSSSPILASRLVSTSRKYIVMGGGAYLKTFRNYNET